MQSFFKSEYGKKEVLSLYDSKLDELNIEYEYLNIVTSYGETNIITSGAVTDPPIIIVHGSNGCAPIAFETYSGLNNSFRVYAVDVLAQPNKSAGVRLDMKDDSYGKWMNEIIAALDLKNVSMAGFSFGGLVILKTLENNDANIKQVFLTAPAYIVNGNPLKTIFKVFIPIRKYMKTQKVKFVEKFLSHLFTDRDEFAVKFLSAVFLHFKMDFTPLPTISKNQAASITTPITLFAAKHDILFPGRKMIRRAAKIFPSLKEGVLLEHSKHVQNKEDNQFILSKIVDSMVQK